jgi:hypothetical protein
VTLQSGCDGDLVSLAVGEALAILIGCGLWLQLGTFPKTSHSTRGLGWVQKAG